LLKRHDPIPIRFLNVKTMRSKAMPDAVKNALSLFQH